MKKVKDQRKKTAIGQKRHAKAVARKGKTYNPAKRFYQVMNGRIVQNNSTEVLTDNSQPDLIVDTETLKL